jgi:hypothetical protein
MIDLYASANFQPQPTTASQIAPAASSVRVSIGTAGGQRQDRLEASDIWPVRSRIAIEPDA